ncbi:MAG: BrnT family toxin [Deltaproteobacteria bacterium]|nr:BrnT family toxin [Deltaproteobacteria bacterium]MBW2681418.1 BrnT family toxin [Deltaproteobacteria bacterium]
MSLEWNYNETTEKNSGPKDRVFQGKTNLDKHGIDFADAATVFDDSNAVTIDSA